MSGALCHHVPVPSRSPAYRCFSGLTERLIRWRWPVLAGVAALTAFFSYVLAELEQEGYGEYLKLFEKTAAE